MKRNVNKVFLAVAIVSAIPSGANAASLLALWDFNGNYLTTNGNALYNLTPGGGVTLVSSMLGMAAEFHGGVTLPITDFSNYSNPALDRLDTVTAFSNDPFSNGFSVMGWVKANTNQSGNIFSHDSSAMGLKSGFQLAVVNGSSFQIFLRDNSDRRLAAVVDGTPIAGNQWHHIGVTWAGSSSPNTFALYVDGQAVSYHLQTSGGSFTGLQNSTDLPIRIGASQGDSSNNTLGFNGQIDHLSLYSGAISANDVHNDYALTVTPEASGSALFLPALLPIAVLMRRSRIPKK